MFAGLTLHVDAFRVPTEVPLGHLVAQLVCGINPTITGLYMTLLLAILGFIMFY